jgi:hypothetical protein
MVWPVAQVAQTPPAQAAPAMHWALLVQLVRQAVAPHTKALQAVVVAAGQPPAPSQVAGLVATPFVQLPARHEVPAPGKTHEALVPVQVAAQAPVPAQAA